jgi:hypothetical protein
MGEKSWSRGRVQANTVIAPHKLIKRPIILLMLMVIARVFVLIREIAQEAVSKSFLIEKNQRFYPSQPKMNWHF